MNKTRSREEYDADSNEPAEPMTIASVGSDDEYDLREHNQMSDVASEYGEVIEDTDNPSLPSGFYKKSVRRQNCFFGISLMHIIAAFIGAYFLMDMSFTRSNVAIFGDEVSMEGSSGEVGIDASNAEVQELIDEEITELEEAGNWGDNAKNFEPNSRFHDIMSNHKVGKNGWTEAKQWWAENKDNLDESKMSKKEKRIVDRFKKKEQAKKRKEDRKKRADERKKENHHGKGKDKGRKKGTEGAFNTTDLLILEDKMSKNFNFTQVHPHAGKHKHDRKKGRGGGNHKHGKNNASNSSGN